MHKWEKTLKRTTFNLFEIPKEIAEISNFQDGKTYFFKITAGNFTCSQNFKMTSGLEIYIPKDIEEKLRHAAKSTNNLIFEYDEHMSQINELEDSVTKALLDTSSVRQKRLQKANNKPKSKLTSTLTFLRNPDVIAEVLHRANGQCESCENKAPFLKKKDNSPYLEVHHIIRLADGGDDTVENAEALCPNCHREKHFG